MRLYLVRHAEAVPEADTGRDFDRVLTDHGHDQAKALAAALKARGVQVDAVVSSPLVRAQQTSTDLIDGLPPTRDLIFCDHLASGELKPRKLSKFLAVVGVEHLAAVGHQPDLGAYAEWLIGAEDGSLPFEKAGAACVEFDDVPRKGAGRLLWVVTPEWFMDPGTPAGDED